MPSSAADLQPPDRAAAPPALVSTELEPPVVTLADGKPPLPEVFAALWTDLIGRGWTAGDFCINRDHPSEGPCISSNQGMSTDTGPVIELVASPSRTLDGVAATELLARLDGQPISQVRRMFGDSKYHNYHLYEWVEENAGYRMTIISRPEGKKGWVKLPIRWTVERTFAWLGKCRRLTKDREKTVMSSEAFIKLAMIHLMLNRLEPKGSDSEFRYRNAA